MPGPKPNAPPTWADTATVEEVREYIMRRIAIVVNEIDTAERTRDGNLMGVAASDARAVATRIDQFRRVCIRRWTAEDSAQTHTHKGTT